MFQTLSPIRFSGLIAGVLSLMLSAPGLAGDLIIYSRSAEPINCTYGAGDQSPETQQGEMTLHFGDRWRHSAGVAGINWVQCSADTAVARNLGLTPTSFDHTLVLAAPPER